MDQARRLEWISTPIPSRNATASDRPVRKQHLFDAKALRPTRRNARSRIKPKPPEKGESAAWISRPALCVQAREGKLYIFMPPVEHLADYLDLVAAIEDTAAHSNAGGARRLCAALRPAHLRS